MNSSDILQSIKHALREETIWFLYRYYCTDAGWGGSLDGAAVSKMSADRRVWSIREGGCSVVDHLGPIRGGPGRGSAPQRWHGRGGWACVDCLWKGGVRNVTYGGQRKVREESLLHHEPNATFPALSSWSSQTCLGCGPGWRWATRAP